MNRRDFLTRIPKAAAALTLASCGQRPPGTREVMTVRGRIPAHAMGFTLPHEHLLVNFQPYEEQQRSPVAYDREEAADVARPHLRRLHDLGGRTLVDATPPFLGRDPLLLRDLSGETGVHIVTATGNYAARGGQHLPPYVGTDSDTALASRWIAEWTDGIAGSGVRPGFIKLGTGAGPLTEVERKLLRAGAAAHLETGLTIGTHTGAAASAIEQLSILEGAGVHPSAWVWIHAQSEKDLAHHVAAARRGAWISFDGVAPDSAAAHVSMVSALRAAGLLRRVLVSHDAGWYHVGEPGGGRFRPFDTVITAFIPALRAAGFDDAEVQTLFVDNPAEAFSIAVRRAR